ncbi:MAG TPA: SurA N-terminal domain-containing protein [Syntrophales bacterium]|nr:SurA N-terminal domain-containing protein [Syntrophales bacterium]
MLELMRKHARSWIMKILLGIIVIVFVLYFGSLGGLQQTETIVTIDGKNLVYADFQREYQNMVEVYRQRLGNEVTDELIKDGRLKQQALDNLIHQTILLKKADEMNIRVSDEDMKNFIMSVPAFQRNGVFDDRLYKQALRYNKVTAEEFEGIQRRAMTIARLEDLVQGSAKVSDSEISDLYRLQNEKMNLAFVAISPADFEGRITPSEKDLESYLKEKGDRYRVAERIQLKVLAFPGKDYEDAVKPSDEDVRDYYDRHKSDFRKDGRQLSLEQVRDRIVAEKKRVEGMYMASDRAKKAHDTIYQDENFDGYAAQNRLNVQVTEFFAVSAPPAAFRGIKDFEKTVFNLKPKEVSPVLSNDRGYLLFQVAQRKPAYVPPLKEIEKEVRAGYVKEEARRKASGEAEALAGKLKAGATLDQVAKGWKIEETGFFAPTRAIPKIGESRDLTEAIWSLSAKKPHPEKAFAVGDRFILVEFKGKSTVDFTDFASRKEAVRNALLQMKQRTILQTWVEGMKTAMVKEGRLKIKKDVKDL